jgi:predicted dehydrogenase
MTKLKVGVVGSGSIAQFHLAAYKANPSAEVVAICDIDRPRAEQSAAEFEIGQVYSDYRDLLADKNVDAVSVCTRNDTHADVAIAALGAGKSVLIEKPMATTVAEALGIVEAETASAGIVQIGYVRRFATNAQVLKSFVDAGDLGEIYYAKASCIRRAGNPGGWFANKKISGGGPLIDLGVHFIDICWYLMGTPPVQSVSGYAFEKIGSRGNISTLPRYLTVDQDYSKNDVEDIAGAQIRFINGSVLAFDVSYSVHGRDNSSVTIFGDKGGAELEPELRIFTEKHNTILEINPQIASLTFDLASGFQNEIDTFVASAQGVTNPVAPAAHGLEMAQIIAAIYQSAALGHEIMLGDPVRQ